MEEEMTDEKKVEKVPEQDTEPNQKDEDAKDGQLVTPPASAPDGPTTDNPGGDPSVNPVSPPPAPLPEQP